MEGAERNMIRPITKRPISKIDDQKMLDCNSYMAISDFIARSKPLKTLNICELEGAKSWRATSAS